MGKARGVSKRRRKAGSFHYKRSNQLKRQRQRELRKCGPIKVDLIRQAWDQKKSLKKNMDNMGLATDPNKLLNGPSFHEKFKKPNVETPDNIVLRLHEKLKAKKLKDLKKKLKKSTDFNVETISSETNSDKNSNSNADNSGGGGTVAEKLSEIANKPSPKNFRFGPDQIQFCSYMLEKYGDDYESMQRDKQNYYQESAGQIRAKIKKFLSIESNRRVYEKAKEICEQKLMMMDNDQQDDDDDDNDDTF